MLDVSGITKSNGLRGLYLFRSLPISKQADAEIAPNGVKHILATTPNSHLEILTPKHVITEKTR